MRVLIVTPSFGAWGGIEAFVLHMAKVYRATPGWQVQIVFKCLVKRALCCEVFDRFTAEGLACAVVSRGDPKLVHHCEWADVVHTQNALPDVLALCRLIGKPTLVTQHNRRMGRSAQAQVWRLGLHHGADRVLFNAQFVAKSWGCVSGARVRHTLSNRIMPFAEIKERSGFVFVGRLVAGKGVEVLVRAYAMAGLDSELWPLTIVGTGPLEAVMRQLVQELGLRHVRVTGFVSEPDKAAILRTAKWLVAVPYHGEDMGLTPLEARACGVPCIVSRDGGITEVAGGEALVCEPGDVADLARSLVEAQTMTDRQYAALSHATYQNLATLTANDTEYVQDCVGVAL
jgi:glycosyltransferase involved in cell wall biosynthesis